MCNGTLMTYWELLQNYDIVIPCFQRDYAQGRDDAQASDVRESLIRSVISAAKNTASPLELDFIYGSTNDRRFEPVDGQQRLTTLHLVHLYLARRLGDDQVLNILRKFTYETRDSSSRFFLLMAGGNLEGQEITIDWKVVRKEGRDLSFYVRDSSGFDLEWDYDPTIEGALRTLDLVHSYLKDSGDEECREILNNLISPIKKAVAFRFMPMERYGLTDDLYIKMNARGLPLTVGERFKSSLEKVLSQAHEESCENIWNEFLDEKPMKGSVVKQDNITNVPPAKRFGLLYDNEWADYFWSVQKGSPVCSEAIEFSVLSRLFALSYILGSTSDIKSILKDNVLATLLRISGKETFVSFVNVFQKVLVLDGNACGTVVVKNVADRMNAIVAYSDRMSNNLSPGWSKQRYDSFPKLISAIAVSAERDYYQRVAVFYSIVLFLEIDKRCDEGLLAEWMRVCWNVIENAPVNDLESLISFTKTIHKCALEYDSFKQNGGGQNSIIDFVATKDFSTGFAAATFLQERMKARMIVSANDRCEAYDLVRKIESGHFFHGDISFQLYKTNSVDEMLERDDWLKSFIDKNGEGDKIDDCRYACFMCGLVTHVRSFSSLRTLFQRNNFNPSEANVHRWLALDKTGGGVGVEAMFGFYCSDKKIMSSAGFYGSECDEMEKVFV